MPVILVDWRRVSLPMTVPTPTTPCTPINRPSVFVADSAPSTPFCMFYMVNDSCDLDIHQWWDSMKDCLPTMYP
jgi:hypothetical protein